MGGVSTKSVSVSGGAGGIVAELDDLRLLAGLYDAAATDCAGTSAALHGYLLDLGNLVSSTLDPAGAAEFEFALEAAIDGPGGVTWVAARCAGLGIRLRAAAEAYGVFASIDRFVGPTLGGITGLPRAFASGMRALRGSANPLDAVDAALAADPRLADLVLAAAPTALQLAGPSFVPVESAATTLEGAADGAPHVRSAGPDRALDGVGPPRSFAGLISGLAHRDDGRDGEIDIRTVTRPGGGVAYIVDIPGTKSWDPLPNGDITSVVTDLRAIRGEQTSYERGVLEAMDRAGIKPTDPVMVVGHSEGGMVAVNAAIHCAQDGRFRITSVVTAGSPIGSASARVPRSVQVLALQNSGDVVPELDGVANAPTPNVSTVTVDHDHGELLDNHDLRLSYVPGAQDVDASADPSIAAFRRDASAFLTGAKVSTQTYVVTRRY